MLLNSTRRLGLGLMAAVLLTGAIAPIANAQLSQSLRERIALSRERSDSGRFADIAILDEMIDHAMMISELALLMMDSDDPETVAMAEKMHAQAEEEITAMIAERATLSERLRQYTNKLN
ncbi:MAG: hypothetical protein AAFY57_04645 [Cyanobacteria bacterium J06642_2]